jgi:hypothetical protein
LPCFHYDFASESIAGCAPRQPLLSPGMQKTGEFSRRRQFHQNRRIRFPHWE